MPLNGVLELGSCLVCITMLEHVICGSHGGLTYGTRRPQPDLREFRKKQATPRPSKHYEFGPSELVATFDRHCSILPLSLA